MQYKNADSRGLLREAFRQVQEKGYKIGNVDITIIAQAPKMRPHIDAMRAKIAEDIQCDIEQVNVKATTTEKLGFTGRQEGLLVKPLLFNPTIIYYSYILKSAVKFEKNFIAFFY